MSSLVSVDLTSVGWDGGGSGIAGVGTEAVNDGWLREEWCVGGIVGVGDGDGDRVGMVDWVPCWCWSRWPKAVATDLGRCFRTLAVVRPGRLAK